MPPSMCSPGLSWTWSPYTASSLLFAGEIVAPERSLNSVLGEGDCRVFAAIWKVSSIILRFFIGIFQRGYAYWHVLHIGFRDYVPICILACQLCQYAYWNQYAYGHANMHIGTFSTLVLTYLSCICSKTCDPIHDVRNVTREIRIFLITTKSVRSVRVRIDGKQKCTEITR